MTSSAAATIAASNALPQMLRGKVIVIEFLECKIGGRANGAADHEFEPA
jgi:hypothetical protein